MVQLGCNTKAKMALISDKGFATLAEDVTRFGENQANTGRSVVGPGLVGHWNLIGVGAGRFINRMIGASHLKTIRSVGPAAIEREGRVHHSGNDIDSEGSFTLVALDSELELKLVPVAPDASLMLVARNEHNLVAFEASN